MKFGYTVVYVNDVPSVLSFYGRAFGIETRFLHKSKQYGELETGGTALAFASHAMGAANLPGGYVRAEESNPPLGVEIALVTEDVRAAFDRAVSAGAVPVAEPKVKPWGQTVGYVRGVDGSLIELCTPVVA